MILKLLQGIAIIQNLSETIAFFILTGQVSENAVFFTLTNNYWYVIKQYALKKTIMKLDTTLNVVMVDWNHDNYINGLVQDCGNSTALLKH